MNRDELLPILLEAIEDSNVLITAVDALRLADVLAKRLPDGPPEPMVNHWTRWSLDEEAVLAEQYRAGQPVLDIAANLGRSEGSIRGAITRLGLVRRGARQPEAVES